MKRVKLEIQNNEDESLVMREESAYSNHTREHQTWDLNDFLDKISLTFVHESEDQLDVEFDMQHVGTSVANAIRRVLIAEVPSMAIEKVFLYQNTSVIPDEVLCHRLGLLPVYANPFHFNFPPHQNLTDEDKEKSNDLDEEPPGDLKENIIFELHVKCKRKKSVMAVPGLDDPEKLFENAVVRTKAIKWVPIGKQAKIYAEDPLRIFSDDIVVAKLRPGQEIEARCHCVKGVGGDHAKFSPVATASYRMLPQIELRRSITGEQAERLVSSFSEGVIGINEHTGVAFVKNPRKDMCSRNIFQHEDIKDAVVLSKNMDHFIFSVESIGAVNGVDLMLAALHLIQAKIKHLHGLVKDELEEVRSK